MMMLLLQFLDGCKHSYRVSKFHKKMTKKMQVSVIFSCQKMNKYQYSAVIMIDRAVHSGIISN